MSDKAEDNVPESVRRIVEAIVSLAIARCDQLGISREDFYRAMLEEQSSQPPARPSDLIEQTFRRLGIAAN